MLKTCYKKLGHHFYCCVQIISGSMQSFETRQDYFIVMIGENHLGLSHTLINRPQNKLTDK